MPMTLADAQQLTQSRLIRGVIQILITESAVLRFLPFISVLGDGISYSPETTLPTPAYHASLDTWSESALDIASQVTDRVTIIGGDTDVDEFQNAIVADKQDLTALTIEEYAKAMAYKFNDGFFNGDGTSNAIKGFGTSSLLGTNSAAMAYSSTVRQASQGATGASLALADMDIFMDALKPGKPDAVFCSKRMRRALTALRRASGSGVLETTRDAFGFRQETYDGVPLYVDENISDVIAFGGGSADKSFMVAVQWGFKRVCGIQNGGIVAQRIGPRETKDAVGWRMKWYAGISTFGNVWSYARFNGVKP